ncbi:hypothetical protein V3C41_00530 [Paenarthrobacter nicotinovorans]|uniref:Uncharacterized protein n=1 Tax=Paenarthrobacter nicotinovorans TaxID=29320 RepID=A0ABV0GM11_PAENI
MRKFKPSKGQVVAGGLAVLIAAAGVTGATVTAQSTIADNKYTVQDAPAAVGPVVTATGAPFDITVTKGQINEASTGTWKVKNTGDKAATVKAILDNSKFVDQPGAPGSTVTIRSKAMNGNGVPDQYLSHKMNKATPEWANTFVLQPGQEKEIEYFIADYGTLAATGTYSMDLKFDYVPAP